jgi:hypothetical protein
VLDVFEQDHFAIGVRRSIHGNFQNSTAEL